MHVVRDQLLEAERTFCTPRQDVERASPEAFATETTKAGGYERRNGLRGVAGGRSKAGVLPV